MPTVRKEKQLLADSRALEEQSERQNPLDGRSGRGATPSIGLSQVRGGATHRAVGGYDSGRYEGASMCGKGVGGTLINNPKNILEHGANAVYETVIPSPVRWVGENLMKMLGLGKEETDHFMAHVNKYKGYKPKKGCGKSKPTAEMEGCGKRAPSKRAELVKKVMKEKGLSLPAASKYVKDNNLYTK